MKELNMKKILKGLIRFYQLVISPYLGNICRFYPTCSNYAIEAIDRYGPIKGTKMIYKGLKKPSDRADLISYLESLK